LNPIQQNAVIYLWHANVPAYPWTTVTDDDELVSSMVTSYLMWEQPYYNYVNKVAFLEDMSSVGTAFDADKDSTEREFCSPCLVNAVCAIGAMSLRHPGAYKFPGDLKSRGHHFVEEAERLIRKDGLLEKPKITTMQV
jgi:hypothetical protein